MQITPLDDQPVKKEGIDFQRISEYENRVLPWEKLGLTWGLIIILTVISILRGDGNDSPVGIVRCDHIDWTLFFILQAICIIFEIIAICIVKKEYQ